VRRGARRKRVPTRHCHPGSDAHCSGRRARLGAKGRRHVGLNVQGIGIDDPDVVFYETFSCRFERNDTNYCSPEVEKLFEQQSRMPDGAARRKLVWEIDKKLQEDGARPVIQHDWRHLLAARSQRREPGHQHHLQSLAVRGCLARPLTGGDHEAPYASGIDRQPSGVAIHCR
jgi:hypothetical protein